MFGALWRKIKDFFYLQYLSVIARYPNLQTRARKQANLQLTQLLLYEHDEVEEKLAQEWGNRLRRIRLQVGDRKHVIAKLEGVTYTQLSAAENGLGPLTEIQRIYRLVSKLEVNN